MKNDIKALADSVFTAVTGYLGKALEPIRESIGTLDAQVAGVRKALEELPTPSDGKDGLPGQDGKDVDMEAVEQLISDAVGQQVTQAVKSLPIPENGKDGADGKDGQDVDPASVEDFLEKAVTAKVQEAVSGIPVPRDGQRGEKGDQGPSGEPGRHALAIQILPSIDPSESYARGTFASYNGGLIHALRTTDPVNDSLEKSGWQMLVEGFPDVEIKQDDQDPRVFVMKATRTSGRETIDSFRIPAVIDAGFYDPRKSYREGDGITWAGSFWIAQKDTATKPEIDNPDWRLSVKKGRNGKDGEKAPTGRAG